MRRARDWALAVAIFAVVAVTCAAWPHIFPPKHRYCTTGDPKVCSPWVRDR